VKTPAADGALGASGGDEVLPDAEDRVLERDLVAASGLEEPLRRALRRRRMCEERLPLACRDCGHDQTCLNTPVTLPSSWASVVLIGS
jgi:hypothetical protein